MASQSDISQTLTAMEGQVCVSSLHDIKQLNVKQLRALLKENGDCNCPPKCRKADLVLRAYAVLCTVGDCSAGNPHDLDISRDVTYEDMLKETVGERWCSDLREVPPLTFIQLYEYLVIKTRRYSMNKLDIGRIKYKRLKSYKYFYEGNIKDIQVLSKDHHKYVKAKVIPSMKTKPYMAMLVFSLSSGEVVKAACECPAG